MKKIIRYLTIFADVSILFWLLYMTFIHNLPTGIGLLVYLAVIFSFLCNIYFLSTYKGNSSTWIGLFFKRKAIEEEQRIKNLQNDVFSKK